MYDWMAGVVTYDEPMIAQERAAQIHAPRVLAVS